MPPARSQRQRTVTNENEENIGVGTTRLTRAKAAALASEDTSSGAGVKKPLQPKKASQGTMNAATQRKRAALGDVSNVTKGEVVEGKKLQGTAKSGLVSKAAQPTGVQKPSRTNSTRSILGAKDNSKKATTELKRAASGSGVLGGIQKKRLANSTSNAQSIKEEALAAAPASKKTISVEIEKREPVETKESNVVESELEELVDVKDVDVKAAIAAGVRDLDAEDLDDPLMVAEYVVEIFDYLKELEQTTMPNPNYMEDQADLEWKMRGILIDWLIEVHTRFHLLPETLFLAVNIIDRFLSTKVVQLARLQLVGVTAMFIASKYEEVLSPHVGNFRHVADDGFTEQEILSAERFVLSALNYDLSYPNPMNFLRRISKADNYEIHTRTLGKYLLEISLLDHRFMCYQPSHIAAAAMYLSRLILERGEWDASLTHYSGYTEAEIKPVFKLMVDYLARPVAHEAFFKKYASKKFLKSSILTRQWVKKYMAYYAYTTEETEEAEDSR
ncbi:MAG: G2/mitotic-specific cyclin [Geoglossum simile]|nr:MAG: G2/mitotic-specific cyclin [Geoglossum simile]